MTGLGYLGVGLAVISSFIPSAARPFEKAERDMNLQFEVGGIRYEQREFHVDVSGCNVSVEFVEQGGGNTWARTAEFRLSEISGAAVRSAGFETRSNMPVNGSNGTTRFDTVSVALRGTVKYSCKTPEAEPCTSGSTTEFVHGARTPAQAEVMKRTWIALLKQCGQPGR